MRGVVGGDMGHGSGKGMATKTEQRRGSHLFAYLLRCQPLGQQIIEPFYPVTTVHVSCF